MKAVVLANPKPAATDLLFGGISFDWVNKLITITLLPNNGDSPVRFHYTGQEAVNLMLYVDTANFALKPLHVRIFEKLIGDGKITGTVSAEEVVDTGVLDPVVP